jgi:hypothetical protein
MTPSCQNDFIGSRQVFIGHKQFPLVEVHARSARVYEESSSVSHPSAGARVMEVESI